MFTTSQNKRTPVKVAVSYPFDSSLDTSYNSLLYVAVVKKWLFIISSYNLY